MSSAWGAGLGCRLFWCGYGCIKRLLHFLIRQACCTAHNSPAQLARADLPGGCNLKLGQQAQSVFPRFEGTDPGGEGWRQHGHHAARQIDRVASFSGLGIQRGTRRDIMRNIGNGDKQPEPISRPFRPDGIVKIFRRGVINGDEREGAKVGASFCWVCGGGISGFWQYRCLSNTPRFFFHLCGKFRRDAVGEQAQSGGHAGCGGRAQKGVNAGLRSLAVLRWEEVRQHDITGGRTRRSRISYDIQRPCKPAVAGD
ncbi:hypothetical protein Amal_04062 [Acetobacter malorum]|uniref:Uncharacterized protein n=1 Tax=Acetobacter malorum TaxID=178901 RepID=A0A177FWH8_9PROT|nr:hypothetical protein Amal_04062 [Acetobacter malorum]